MKTKLLSILMIMVLMLTLLTGCGGSGDATAAGDGAAAEKVEWKLASCWADGTFMFEIDAKFCENVGKITGGNFTITPYGVGQLGAATEVFDLVKNGTVQAGGDWPSYWAGYDDGFDLLATTMFNFTGWDYYLWIYEGGGLEDAYNYMFNQYGMRYYPTVACQMESGIRSNVPINSIEDMQSMKIRLAGKIQGLVAAKLGITPVSVAANELYESLQRGVIDAAEYSVPSNDVTLHIEEVTKYWLTPGWHQTSSVYGTMVNQAAFDALPTEYQEAIDMAAKLTFQEYTAKYAYNDAEATRIMIEDYGIQTTSLSEEDMAIVKAAWEEATAEMCAGSEHYAHVYESMMNYREHMSLYREALGEFGFGINLD